MSWNCVWDKFAECCVIFWGSVMSVQSREEVIDYIANLKAVELADFIDELKKVLNVEETMMAAQHVVASPAGSAESQDSKEQEKTEFEVHLGAVSGSKIAVIKVVRRFMKELGLKDAKDLVDSAPCLLKTLGKEEAGEFKKELEEAGATVELK